MEQFDLAGIILALFSETLKKLHWGFQCFQAKHTPLEITTTENHSSGLSSAQLQSNENSL